MSYPASQSNTTLSLPARLLCYIGLPSAILLTSLSSPKTALLSPLAFLPPYVLYRRWLKAYTSNPSRRGELEPMLWTGLASATLGLATVSVCQIAVCKAASILLFGSEETRRYFFREFIRNSVEGLSAAEVKERAAMAASWQNWVFNFAFSFVGASLVEESMKYAPVVYAQRRGTPEERRPRDRAYIDYVVAGSLGFSVVEMLGYISMAYKNNESLPKLALTILERVGGVAGHLSVACLTALRATKRDYYGADMSWWQIMWPAVLFHGTCDFMVFSFSAWEGNVGFIHPKDWGTSVVMIAAYLGVTGSAVWCTRREWRLLDEEDQLRSLPEEMKG